MRALPLTMLLLALTALPAQARRERVPDSANKQCINRNAIRDETAESDSRLIFHVGSRAYRNYLPASCQDLVHINNVGKLRLKSADPDKLCVGDTVEMVDRDGLLGVGGDPQTTRCTLGSFEPISEMSLTEALRR